MLDEQVDDDVARARLQKNRHVEEIFYDVYAKGGSSSSHAGHHAVECISRVCLRAKNYENRMKTAREEQSSKSPLFWRWIVGTGPWPPAASFES